MAAGVLALKRTRALDHGVGAVFAGLYQLAGFVWLVALVVVAARTTAIRRWRSSILTGLLLVVVYSMPVSLLIR